MEQAYSDTNAGLHYDLRLEIDPRTSFIAVSGSLAYHSPQHQLQRASFYLHRQLNISRLEGRRVLGYQYEPNQEELPSFLPQASILDIYFNPPLGKEETALIQFDYQGNITDWPVESANVITTDWSELGRYLPWFPMQYNGTPSSLTFTLKVKCPAGYQVSSYGNYTLADGNWFFNWPHPTNDIVVAVGTSLEPRLYESETNHVYFASSTFSEAASTQLGEEMLWILDRLSGWYGPTRPSDFTLIESPRALGGSYARRSLIVLSGLNELDYLNQREPYLRYLAHEAAHTWWWEAPTDSWEDWLNESLAEYSAMLAIRERYGTETFDRFMSYKRERVPDFLPLWKFDRQDISTPEKQAAVDRLLYDKGTLVLHSLAERISHQRFLEFCRAMLWSGVTGTGHMLDLLEEVEDKDTRRWMEEELKG